MICKDGRPCTHFIGFKDDKFWSAVKVWGRPHFIHRYWDKRAEQEIEPGDLVIFARDYDTMAPYTFDDSRHL